MFSTAVRGDIGENDARKDDSQADVYVNVNHSVGSQPLSARPMRVVLQVLIPELNTGLTCLRAGTPSLPKVNEPEAISHLQRPC